MNLQDAKDLIKTLYKLQVETGERYSVELVSGPGVGKSQAVAQCVKELGDELEQDMMLKEMFLTTVEQPDVGGFRLPGEMDEDGRQLMTITKAPWMPEAKDPDHGILLLDEFRQADEDVVKPAAELFLRGRVAESQLPVGWMVVACSNRMQDRSGVHQPLAYMTNRRIVVHIEPDLNVWVDWALTNDVPWQVVTFAKAHPSVVFANAVPDDPGPFCTPRALVKMGTMLGKLPDSLLVEAGAGTIGEGAMSQFMAHMAVESLLPTWEEVVADPEGAKLPDSEHPDAQLAAMHMVAFLVDEDTVEEGFTYLTRLPGEFQLAGIKMAMIRTPSISSSSKFTGWLKKNQNLLLELTEV